MKYAFLTINFLVLAWFGYSNYSLHQECEIMHWERNKAYKERSEAESQTKFYKGEMQSLKELNRKINKDFDNCKKFNLFLTKTNNDIGEQLARLHKGK